MSFIMSALDFHEKCINHLPPKNVTTCLLSTPKCDVCVNVKKMS